jgi:RNA polymerase sigma factor (sigma-70 family)
MAAPTVSTRRVAPRPGLPAYLFHPSFKDESAPRRYDPQALLDDRSDLEQPYMPDEKSREFARRMHYSAYRAAQAPDSTERARWLQFYFQLRDRIILGNRKLIFRAVRRRTVLAAQEDDYIGDCQVVLIHAVAAFNPWLNIRFSTYAYTCLIRALSRRNQRMAHDCLAQALSFDALPDGEPNIPAPDTGPTEDTYADLRLDELLHHDHPLLTPREKAIVKLRFGWNDDDATPTLEQVGQRVGLSKERVRQVQTMAIAKLRSVLIPR